MTPDMVYSEHEEWFKDHDDTLQALNHNEQSLQQRHEEHKMADFILQDNSYQLFTNAWKKEGSNQPDFKGDALIDGKAKKISGWKKTDKNGNPYLSGAFEDPEDSAKRFPSDRDTKKPTKYDPFAA